MIKPQTSVQIYRTPTVGGLNFLFLQHLTDGRIAVGKPTSIDFQIIENENVPIEPTFILGTHVANDVLQSLAEELHKMGIHAKDDEPKKNELSAVKFHLEDMRKLVFDK